MSNPPCQQLEGVLAKICKQDALIKDLMLEVSELRKEVKPIIIKHKLEKQHEEQKARGVYDKTN